MRNVLKKVKFINYKRQAPNLGRILCKSSFSPSNSISGVKNCGKGFVCCQYIKEGIEHTFKTVDKKFEIRIPFNCESKNLIYIVICRGCKEEGHIRTCGGGNFKIMQFFAIWEDKKILRESYEIYFIKNFKPALNERHK